MKITEKKEEKERANRELRDSMYTARYAEPDKAKLMSQPVQDAAAIAGVTVMPSVPTAVSPYRLP